MTRGETFIHPHLTPTFIQYFRILYEGFKPFHEQQELEQRNDQDRKNKFEAPTLFHITQREIEILQLIAEGKNNKQISKQLLISEKKVKNHVSNILFKSDLQDRTQALIFAIRHGWVTLK
jgi:two-component system response regulator DegU